MSWAWLMIMFSRIIVPQAHIRIIEVLSKSPSIKMSKIRNIGAEWSLAYKILKSVDTAAWVKLPSKSIWWLCISMSRGNPRGAAVSGDEGGGDDDSDEELSPSDTVPT